MSNYRRALQLSIVFLFTGSMAACGGGGGGGGGSPNPGVTGDSGNGTDQSGPSVTITNPDAPEIDTTDLSMDLKGTSQSPNGIASVSWESDSGEAGSASGTESWSISRIPLKLGSNTITVTATDTAGQTHGDKIVINRESDGTGSVTLSWVAPTERTDGTPLQNLGGYKISYGRMSKVYDYTISIDNPGLTTYVVEGLKPGSWYFALVAYDTEGLESDFSNEARLRVQ